MKGNGDIDEATEVDIAEQVDASIYKDALEIMKDRFETEGLYDRLIKAYEENNL